MAPDRVARPAIEADEEIRVRPDREKIRRLRSVKRFPAPLQSAHLPDASLARTRRSAHAPFAPIGAVPAPPQRRPFAPFSRPPDAVLAHLLPLPNAASAAAEPSAAVVLGPDFRAKFSDADTSLALLGGIAVRPTEEFAEFIRPNRTSHHQRRCAVLVAWVPRAFLPVMGYLIRAKNHSAIVPIPIFGSHAATAGSTICFVANEAATFANT